MAGFGDLVQKAFYLGVGAASYAGEKAGSTLGELRSQAQKLTDELVARGELTAEEAQRVVNDMVGRAESAPKATVEPPKAPRHIEILDEDDGGSSKAAEAEADEAEMLKRQVEALRQELQNMKRQA